MSSALSVVAFGYLRAGGLVSNFSPVFRTQIRRNLCTAGGRHHRHSSVWKMSFTPKDSTSEESSLYPCVESHVSGMLKVSPLHNIYWEEAGNPEGVPVLFVHGGPGGGIEPKCRRFFDPEHYRIILFSQRGCGKSTPLGCLQDNTTWALVRDMEMIREERGVSKWMLFGGSWGSCLSLAYAQAHPDRVSAMVLRGIFTLRKSEVCWFYERGGAGMLYPSEFDDFVCGLPEASQDAPSLINAYHDVLNGEDAEAAKKAALAWSSWEGATSYFRPTGGPMKYNNPDFAIVFARIECHYFKSAGFFPRDGALLEKASIDKIRHIPTAIVQGRWDVVCPIRTAYDLHSAFPEADMYVVESAGHSSFEVPISAKLVEITDKFRA